MATGASGEGLLRAQPNPGPTLAAPESGALANVEALG